MLVFKLRSWGLHSRLYQLSQLPTRHFIVRDTVKTFNPLGGRAVLAKRKLAFRTTKSTLNELPSPEARV